MSHSETIPVPDEQWFDDLKSAGRGPSWLWQGNVAAGNLTLLTSQWKSGKTTLTTVLLARLKTGGSLGGLSVEPSKAVVISEEGPDHWASRGRKLDLNGHVCWFCRPFRTKPRKDQWLALIDRIGELRRKHGLGLLVIDPLAAFLPGRDENCAGTMLEALLPLQRLTAEGMAVLVLHHPRKGDPPAGQAARGSGALAGYVDVLIEMSWYGRSEDNDRRRRLRAWSRHDGTPRELILELNEDGADYTAHGDFETQAHAEGWPVLMAVMERTGDTMTREDVIEEWPPGLKAPSETALWRWLERGVAEGSLCRMGKGKRNSPFRYWLAGREPRRNGLPELPELEELY